MTEDELAHHGIKGMHWGQRKKVTSDDIKSARTRLANKGEEFRMQKKAVKKAKGTNREGKERSKLDKMHMDLLNNPDRPTALRMTNGEKFLSVVGSTILLPGAGTAISVGTIATRNAVASKIEKKQQAGAYNKKK